MPVFLSTQIPVKWLTHCFPGSLKSHLFGCGLPKCLGALAKYSTTDRIQECHSSMDNLGCMVSWSDCFLADYLFFWVSAQKTDMVPVLQHSWADLDCWPTTDRKYALCLLWNKFFLKTLLFAINSPFAFFILIHIEKMPQIIKFL